jgi:hypothetical protein
VISIGTKIPALLPLDVDINPNSNGLPGIGQLRSIVGASMTVGLILAVLALIVSAARLGARSELVESAPGGPRASSACSSASGAAIVTGASVALVNFFWNVGQAV